MGNKQKLKNIEILDLDDGLRKVAYLTPFEVDIAVKEKFIEWGWREEDTNMRD